MNSDENQKPEKFQHPTSISPMTPENWEAYYEECGTFGMIGYIDSTERSIEALQHILITSKDFQELKEQLTLYIQDRQTLLDAAPAEKWTLSEKINQKKYLAFIQRTAAPYF